MAKVAPEFDPTPSLESSARLMVGARLLLELALNFSPLA
jgi:hypothetical protein